MMKALIKKWLSKYNKYFFTYTDGFFELPFLANSPALIVESFKSMPFIKKDDKLGKFATSNLFLKGSGYYQELDSGLWIILSDSTFRKNISFKIQYDENLPKEYHCLVLYLNKSVSKFVSPTLSDIEIQDQSWVLLKAGGQYLNSHFKGQHSIYLNIYFTDKWLQNNILGHDVERDSRLIQFLDGEEEYLYFPNLIKIKADIYQQIIDIFQNRTEISNINKLILKAKTYELCYSFVEMLTDNTFHFSNITLPEADRRKIVQIQHHLEEVLLGKFPKIEKLAKMVHISETKLKSDFKKVNSMTIYQYFSMRQMQVAKEMIHQQKISIKETAFTLGYENHSKFSQAYRRVFGQLPSEDTR